MSEIKKAEDGKLARKSEPEHKGPLWIHPYALYAILNMALLIIVGIVVFIALKAGWIPKG